MSGKSIASLQGIEHFTALVSLDAGNNLLTTLDMSGNPALEGNGFVAANNQLDTLVLPDIPGFQVEAEVFYEQNPRTGYDRVERYLDPDFTRPVAADGVLEATGQTLYARWLPNPYTVYYFANEGGGTMAPQPAVYGSEFALTPCAFARTGYTFAGWSTYSDGVGGRSYADGQLVQNLAGENSSRTAAYLYAQWQANKYTVSYNANGGQGDLPATDALYGADFALPDAGVSRADHLLLGWAREPGAAQPDYFPGQTVRDLTAEADGAVTLYAVWLSNAEIQQGYLDQLAALGQRYAQSDYYPEDWQTITAALAAADQAIRDAGSAPGQVTSADAPALEQLEEQLDALDAAAFYCDPAATAAVCGFARLAADKKAALAELEGFYADMLAAWQYSPEGRALLEEKKQATAAEIEAADASGRVSALLVAGKADLGLVDPLPKAPVITAWPAAKRAEPM